ncbi:MAG: prenyltransferase/squalene oxidase repeat-containing protein [Phycisphaerae bacterium]
MSERNYFGLAVWVAVAGMLLVGCSKEDTDANANGNGVPDLSYPEPATDAIDQTHTETAQKLINGGVRFLLRQQRDDGGWSFAPDQPSNPALTAMVLKTLAQHPDLSHQTPAVKKGYDLMLSFQQPNGGIYDTDSPHRQENYTTAVAVMALAAAENPEWNDEMGRAVDYLKGLQIVPGSETGDGDVIQDANHPFVGGVSYGKHGRPDMSNVSMFLQALEESGVPGDDPAVQRARLFAERAQNLQETNPLGWAEKGPNDGGFIYAPAKRDAVTPESKAGELRSYGSMTYAGFKSLLYAGVDRQDQRVQRAFDWIRQHWELDVNPNMPSKQSREGLYYYYHIFAKALRAWGQPVITDPEGEKHNWREELVSVLAEQVNDDGSWTGDKRWYERTPILATSYSVLALQEAFRK